MENSEKTCTKCEQTKHNLVIYSFIGVYMLATSLYGTYVILKNVIELFTK
jgi:hypothetical protein